VQKFPFCRSKSVPPLEVPTRTESVNRGGTACVQGQRRGRDSRAETGRAEHSGHQPIDGYSRKTITRYLLKPAGRPVYGPRPAQASKLEPFKPYLKERLKAGVWNAQVLLRELRERSYPGSYTILTDWLRPQRKEALSVAVRRFETPPGKQAQVDWGHLGSLTEQGVERALWGFTITLGYSWGFRRS